MATTENLDLLLAEIDLLKADLQFQSLDVDPELQQALDIVYTHDSLRLEGSSLEPIETEMVIRNGLMLPGKPMTDNLTALNHYQAVQFIREQADEQNLLELGILQKLHIILCRGIQQRAGGAYRTEAASLINGDTAAAAEQIPKLLSDDIHWLNRDGAFLHPVIFAAEAHLRLLTLLPFPDNNGICARLLMNLILLRESYPLASINSQPTTRTSYIAAFAAAHRGERAHWHLFIAGQVRSSCQHLLGRLQQSQIEN